MSYEKCSFPLPQRIVELRNWEAANPALAKDWDAACAEDKVRAIASRVLSQTPAQLLQTGAPSRLVREIGSEERLKRTPALCAAYDFIARQMTFLVLLGPPGVGKSFAAVAALADFLRPIIWNEERRYIDESDEDYVPKAMFITASDLSRTTSSDFSKEDRLKFRRTCSTPYLVLDDLGVERPSDGWHARLDELLDHRYGHKLRTIITSNFGPDEFKNHCGLRVADRIRHDGMLILSGKDSLRHHEG